MAKLTTEEIISALKGKGAYSLANAFHLCQLHLDDVNEALFDAVKNGIITKDEFLKLAFRVEEAHSINFYELMG